MLAQLLIKHRLRAHTVPYDAVSRSKIASFDPGDAAMVCITYLDIRGNPAHLRYLLRRLREKLPHAHILVGFWPSEDPVLKRQEGTPAAAADSHVTSPREAVQACLSAAHREKELT